MPVIDVESFVEVLLGDDPIRIVQNLTTFSIVLQALAYGVREFTTGVNVSKENIDLLIISTLVTGEYIARSFYQCISALLSW